MTHYKYPTKKGWLKSEIFQSDPVTKAVNAANEILREEVDEDAEVVYVDIYSPLGGRKKLCSVNDNLMLDETRKKLLNDGLLINPSCPVCDYSNNAYIDINYCPNCGQRLKAYQSKTKENEK